MLFCSILDRVGSFCGPAENPGSEQMPQFPLVSELSHISQGQLREVMVPLCSARGWPHTLILDEASVLLPGDLWIRKWGELQPQAKRAWGLIPEGAECPRVPVGITAPQGRKAMVDRAFFPKTAAADICLRSPATVQEPELYSERFLTSSLRPFASG